MKFNLITVSDMPWMPREEIEWLDGFLSKEMSVFEYGSGGSTVYIARRVKKIVSVEYQLKWFLKVRLALIKNRVRNYQLILAKPEKRNFGKGGYLSSDPVFKEMSFQKFVTTIDRYPDGLFDLVIVDGRARNSCISRALTKVKKGGCIFLDDSDRQEYGSGKDLLEKYKKTKLSRATVWKIS